MHVFFWIRAFIRRENFKGRIKVHLKLFRLLVLDGVAIGLQNREEMLTSAKDVEWSWILFNPLSLSLLHAWYTSSTSVCVPPPAHIQTHTHTPTLGHSAHRHVPKELTHRVPQVPVSTSVEHKSAFLLSVLELLSAHPPGWWCFLSPRPYAAGLSASLQSLWRDPARAGTVSYSSLSLWRLVWCLARSR